MENEKNYYKTSIPELSKGSDNVKKLNKNAEKKKEEKGIQPVPYIQLFRFTSTKEKLYLFVGTLAALLSSFCFPILNVLFGEIAELMVEMEKEKVECVNGTAIPQTTSAPTSTDTSRELDDFLNDISTLSIFMAIAGLVQLICGYLMISIFTRVAQQQVFRIRKLYLNALLRQNVGWFDTVTDTNFISRISEDMVKIQEAIGDKVALCIYYFLNSVISLSIAFYYGWLLTLVVLSSAPVITLASFLMSSLQSKLSVKEQKAYGISGSAAQEALINVKTVMAFGAQHQEIQRYEKNLVFAQKAGKKRGAVSALGTGVLWFLNYASYALAFWYGTKLIFDDQEKQCEEDPTYGTAVLLIVFFNVLTGSFNISQSLSYLETFSVGRGAAANIYSVIDRTPEIDSYSDTGRNPKERLQGKIEFRNIHFAYPSRPEVKVLNGFNLTIMPGSVIALVGSSGNGKSTILQLLQRFYDPLEGSILVDDTNIRDFNLNWFRSQIGVVSQEPVLFNTTIADNIKYGRDGLSEKDIEDACQLSNALAFISKLPNKFETVVGDRGSQLSGGQKQRIAIARSLVKNPAILLLDEATSALDTQSEKIVQVALERASSGRTTLIVAHRLSTIRAADLIVSLQNGKVVEMGTHNELLEKKGHYFDLVTAQMSGVHAQEEEEENMGENSKEKDITASGDKKEALIEDEEERIDDISLSTQPILEKSAGNKTPIVYRLLKLNVKEWPLITTGIVMSIAHGCILPVYALFFGNFLGILSLSDSEEARDEANYYALMFLFIGIAAGLTIFGALLSFSFAGEALTNRLRRLAFAAMMKQSTSWYDNPQNSVGALCTRLSADAASVQGATGTRLGTVVQAFTTIAISTGLSLYVLPKVGAVALSFVPFIVLAAYYSGKMMEGQQVEEKKATEDASKLAYQAVTNIRTVASLCKEKAFVQMYSDALLSPHLKALRHSHVLGFVYGLAQSLLYFAYATVMYYGGTLIQNEGIDYTKIFIIGEALIWTMLMLGQTLAFAPNYNKAKVAGSRIMELLDTRPEMDLSPGVGLQMRSCEGHTTFDKVHFSYPTRPMSKILKGLNLKIEPNMKLGVCGPSGSGKSTCIQLILRFYDPTTGEVQIDDIDIARLNINCLRSQMALVAQEPSLFDRSLAENIAYGDNSREVPMTDIIEAARAANIHDFISSLPSGYETRVGQMGSQLSGGQKQRIAIARSLVRNPSILLLDEATSALDTESEKIVQATLDKASTGRTTFIIAHRLSSIQNCDKIIVVNNGVLSECGTHTELLNQRGIYYKLWNMQGHES